MPTLSALILIRLFLMSGVIGLAAQVRGLSVITIDRDDYGVPHIYGATDADVAFGFGYAQAQDHLILMLRNYREAAGRLAEIEGAPALETDRRTRLWRIHEEAARSYNTLKTSTKTCLGAFTDGVNRFMDDHPDQVPEWAEPVNPVDALALYRLLHVRLNEWRMPELRAMTPAGMSNQWALAPSKTTNGNVICAMDPHVPWVPIFRMHEAHLISASGLNLYGGAPFGLPTIILGHTDRHAWSFTINGCDISDLYIENLNPDNPLQYSYQSRWLNVETWEETFRVRTDNGYEERKYTLSRTHHGPIIATSGDQAFALRLSASDIDDPMTVFLDLARASDLARFKSALDNLDIPLFNIVYGDKKGNIYYVYNERCPVRSEAFDWRQPVPRWRHTTEWQTYYPFSLLPQIENPDSGFLQNCNNAPWYVTADSGIHPDKYPSYLVSEEQNGRSRRVFERLSRPGRLSVEDNIDLILDENCITADEYKPRLLEAFRRQGANRDGRLSHAIDLLTAWDHAGDVNSEGMTLFTLWKIHYDRALEKKDGDTTDEPRLMLDALSETVASMMDRYGRLNVPWGDVHRLRRGERTYPVGGSSKATEALRPVGGALNEEGFFIADYGSTITMVVELGDSIRAWTLVPYGNSENPNSPHYDDQIVLWTRKALKPARFTRQDVENNLESRETLRR